MGSYTLYALAVPEGRIPRLYVGVTAQKPTRRWNGGEGYKSSAKFYQAIKACGWNNVRHFIIAEGLTQEEAYRLEREEIGRMRLTALGWNVAPGGKEPWNKGKTGVFTAEALEKMRRAKIGNKYAAKKRKGPKYEGNSDSEPEGRRWEDNDSR